MMGIGRSPPGLRPRNVAGRPGTRLRDSAELAVASSSTHRNLRVWLPEGSGPFSLEVLYTCQLTASEFAPRQDRALKLDSNFFHPVFDAVTERAGAIFKSSISPGLRTGHDQLKAELE